MKIKSSDQPELNLGFGDHVCNWGIHIAGLYENDTQRDDIIYGFLNQGLIEKDIDLFCPVERSIDGFIDSFASHCGRKKSELLTNDNFQILPAKDIYYPNGTFSPFEMDKNLNSFFEESQKNGPRNIRATAEMVWALDAVPGREHLFAYESRLNYFIPGKPWVSICMYNTTKFSGSTIMDVLRTHPYTISNGVLMQNPYFIDPDIWLAENAPQFLYSKDS
ncbi:MAG: MEDS domain-containing protein [Spirochaetes bacterium]|nr:MEDS domain-containing protein [Spirochaetota bacterium]MBN2770158.1 MEDS domain-containing protein [Spirochaetota bacterium]